MTHPLFLGCAALTLLAGIFLAGLGVGFGLGRVTGQGGAWAQTAGAPASADFAVERNAGARAALVPAFEIFWEAMDLLYRDYYGALPDAQEAAYSAIRSVLNLLNDPNTSFLTPEEAEFFRTNIEGSFEGIGARVSWDVDANTLVITEPFENQPAWLAGLKRDDLVLAVDDQSLVGTNLADAIKLIRGPKGSPVLLTIQRPGTADPFDVKVVRDRIEIPTISTDTVGAGRDIAYVRLNSFNENSGQLVRQAVEDAVERDPRAIILDLRGNTGGLLREAVRVASVFLEDETVLLERFSDGRVESYETSGRAVTTDIPLVVLVNEASASASEIVAGALQDSGRATLVGATTFGKGSVQLPHNLSNSGILRVTIARWYTPKDRSIDGVGLTPDLAVEITDEQRASAEDPQLDAAVEYLEATE